MSDKGVVDKLFEIELKEGNVLNWCNKRKSYIDYRMNFKKYEAKVMALINNKFSQTECNEFEILLENLKGAIYDSDLEEKEYYFKKGYKEGMKTMKELFE